MVALGSAVLGFLIGSTGTEPVQGKPDGYISNAEAEQRVKRALEKSGADAPDVEAAVEKAVVAERAKAQTELTRLKGIAEKQQQRAVKQAVREALRQERSRAETATTRGFAGDTGGTDPRFAFCYEANDAGFGPYTQGKDPEYAWYVDRDGDGVVCES